MLLISSWARASHRVSMGGPPPRGAQPITSSMTEYVVHDSKNRLPMSELGHQRRCSARAFLVRFHGRGRPPARCRRGCNAYGAGGQQKAPRQHGLMSNRPLTGPWPNNVHLGMKCSNFRLLRLLDDLGGKGEHRRRHRQAERFGSFEIDDQVEFRGLNYRQISRLLALENAANIDADTAVAF